MNCADVEILLADYVDGTLTSPDKAEQKSALETHIAHCTACAALAQDAAAAVALIGRAAEVDAPPELVTRILFELREGNSRVVVKPSWGRRVFGKWLEPVLQPRLAMGMAMTVLSLGIMLQSAGVRQLTRADLDPVKVWTSAEDHVTRWWNRGMKYYESLRVVYEIQSRLKEWNEEQAAAGANNSSETPQTKSQGDTQ